VQSADSTVHAVIVRVCIKIRVRDLKNGDSYSMLNETKPEVVHVLMGLVCTVRRSIL